eukprot:374529-Amphidinium_carterae.1
MPAPDLQASDLVRAATPVAGTRCESAAEACWEAEAVASSAGHRVSWLRARAMASPASSKSRSGSKGATLWRCQGGLHP